MKKHVLLFIFILVKCIAFAQNDPWTAKFIAIHPDRALRDTFYVGIDPAGGDGYQPGLDSIDTNFAAPIGIRGHDLQVMNDSNASQPANMKKDIRALFDTTKSADTLYWKFYVESDSFPGDEPPFNNWSNVVITWDTNEFKYVSGNYKLWKASVDINGGYIDAIDMVAWGIISYGKYFSGGGFARDSVFLMFAGTCSDYLFWGPPVGPCYFGTSTCQVMQFLLEVIFVDTTTVGYSDYLLSQSNIKIFPNPFSEKFTITFSPPFSGTVEIYNVYGKRVYLAEIKNFYRQSIIINDLQKGIYMLKITDKQKNHITVHKLLHY